ncbi:hypothetical protein FDECE_17453 [Fusarium decemcellulare]|nr:hypothetical protein FDECE_17453 [Fusarium decemcellulare]
MSEALILQDYNVSAGRAPNTPIVEPWHLTAAEKVQLMDLLQTYSCMHEPRLVITMADFERFVDKIFGDWNSLMRETFKPILKGRRPADTAIIVGRFKKTLPPLSEDECEDPRPERMIGAQAFLGDSRGRLVNPKDVALRDGWTQLEAKMHAVDNYDTLERKRILNHNLDVIVAYARRRVQKWSIAGTASEPFVRSDDRVRSGDIVPLVLATERVWRVAQMYSELGPMCASISARNRRSVR